MNAQKPEALTTLEKIISKASGVSIEEMYSKSRMKPLCAARHAVWEYAHTNFGMSYTSLARLYNRDHTTIMNGVRKMLQNPALTKIAEGVEGIDPTLVERGKSQIAKSVQNWVFDGVLIRKDN